VTPIDDSGQKAGKIEDRVGFTTKTRRCSSSAGVVWVNHMQPTFVEAPWVGSEASGFGRELG